MKLVCVLGSSRNESISQRAAMRFIEGAKEAGFETVIFKANEMNIKGCIGCGACRKNGTDCVINDDMQEYYKELLGCDALLVTAPNYYSQPSGTMITFMNRHYCMTNSDKTQRLKPGIKLSGIFAQGADEEYQKYFAHYDWYLGTFTSKGMELKNSIIIGGNSDIDKKLTDCYEAGKSL